MPWYVAIYLLALAAMAVASWQVAERMPRFVPGWLRNGALLAACGQILATCAYWNDDIRGALGLFAVPLVVALVGWLVFAIGPAIEATRALVAAGGGSQRRVAVHGYAGAALAFALAAPSLYFGLRVAVSATGS